MALQLPKLSPTALHWATLVGSAFAGGVMGAVGQDGGAASVFADLGDPDKRWPVIGGAIIAGLGSVLAMAQRSLFPAVSVKAVDDHTAAAIAASRKSGLGS